MYQPLSVKDEENNNHSQALLLFWNRNYYYSLNCQVLIQLFLRLRNYLADPFKSLSVSGSVICHVYWRIPLLPHYIILQSQLLMHQQIRQPTLCHNYQKQLHEWF